MNNNDIDSALRELAATPLPAAPDLRAQVHRAIAERNDSNSRGHPILADILSWHRISSQPLPVAAVLALAVLVGVAQTVAWPDASISSQRQRQAVAALHLDSFTARGQASVAPFSQPNQER